MSLAGAGTTGRCLPYGGETFVLARVLLRPSLQAQVLEIIDTNPIHFLILILPLYSANSYNGLNKNTHTKEI